MELLPLRLLPGTDLRREIEAQAAALGPAFVVSGIGSLAEVRIRFAAAREESRLSGPYEILSLSGSVTTSGAHLHMAVADAAGQVLGGHVGYGNVVRTTAEILLASAAGWELERRHDDATGYRELVVRRPSQAGRGADLPAHFRLARPVADLGRTETMYRSGLGWVRLAHFEDHAGFDGVMLGTPGGAFHFEFTYCRTHPVAPSTTPEDLLVFYVPDRAQWAQRCTALLDAGFVEVESLNPYWARDGRTFEDADGYRVVIQCAAWKPDEHGAAHDRA